MWYGINYFKGEDKPVDTPTGEVKHEGYEKINPNVIGIYNKLSFILDNTFEQHIENGIHEIPDALSINGNILDRERYKYEFAFQFGHVYGYSNYLDEDVTEETGAYWLKKSDYESVYNRVYGSTATNLSKYLEDGYYKTGIFTGYTGVDERRFVETTKLNFDNIYYLEANIYNNPDDCSTETNEELNLVVGDYCLDYGKKIGRIEIVYSLNDNNEYVIKEVCLYDLNHSDSIKSKYGF